MSISQLYNSLKKDNVEKPLTNEERDDLSQKIKLLDEKGFEMVYVIIKMFDLDTNHKKTPDLPFESKIVSKELKFDLDKIPDKLKHMIYKFLYIHIKNMDEESKINIERQNLVI